MLKNFWKNESGQGMVEYGLIIALIAVVVIVALTSLGTSVSGIFDKATKSLDEVTDKTGTKTNGAGADAGAGEGAGGN